MQSRRAARGIAVAALLTTSLLSGAVPAQATCPPAGSAYTIKGFTGDTHVTAAGATPQRRDGCLWKTEDGRDLWWRMGDDVRPAPRSRPARTGRGWRWYRPLAPGSVYRCTLPGIGMFTGAYFGIVDSKTYRNFDGKRGNYSYDAATGTLRLISAPSRDWHTAGGRPATFRCWTTRVPSPAATARSIRHSRSTVAGSHPLARCIG